MKISLSDWWGELFVNTSLANVGELVVVLVQRLGLSLSDWFKMGELL